MSKSLATLQSVLKKYGYVLAAYSKGIADVACNLLHLTPRNYAVK